MIKCFYYDKGNYGDILTPFLIQKLFGISIQHVSTINKAELFAVGSILERLEEARDDLVIWGSGFMYEPGLFIDTWSGPQKFLAVRGKMTASRIENFDGALGDPGLLVSRLPGFNHTVQKTYKIGFIPHYIDRFHENSRKIRSLPGVHYIEIMQSPNSFIREVQKCDFVISSSLHGLVTADAYHIPNIHVQLSDGVYGKNYKYKDYYSTWDMDHKFVDLRQGYRNLTTEQIIKIIEENYQNKKIDDIQDNLIKAFKDYYGVQS